jgi:putative ABC transport system permease protein
MGGVMGILLTLALSAPIGALMKLTITLSVGTVLLSLIFSLLVGVAFGVYPAIKAGKLRPVEALHYE